MPRKLGFIPTANTFKLGDQIGSGTVGVVFRATSPQLKEPVALKLLHPLVSSDDQMIDRFEREIKIMEQLNHPHIVKHFGGGILEGQHFYAMQLLEFGSLKERLSAEGPLPWAKAAAYTAQIASALQHSHNHGIVHRDLKPSNLFFDSAGNIVLGDFGIALDTGEADISGHGITVGTVSYMSPEQICADGKVTGQSDLYSLGCVLFEMLTGSLPFQGINFAQIWEQHLHKTPPTMAELSIDCPVWLDELIAELLAKKPEDRPFNARQVQGFLQHHLQEELGDASDKLIQPIEQLHAHSEEQAPRTWVLWIAFGVILAVIFYAMQN